jgi:NADP-dependent 3-hydroxy acid dehydrogenase YdfG
MNQLSGKVALVTRASSGQGSEVAKLFADAGAGMFGSRVTPVGWRFKRF